ncbi:NAD(P)-binding domain-containing protein [Priestia megaterium]|uniref:NAD(P)-binding domain-containing protein n=1 Tax=Priestia megaterium TaxID=1404 RepID=UPI00398F98B1
MIKEKISQEIDNIKGYKDLNILATVGTTARDSIDFVVLPRRKALNFYSINFLVSDSKVAEQCFRFLDGKVKFILIDVEAKKKIDIENIARTNIKKSIIIPYKPNDVTLEAADLFLLNHFNLSIKHKNILIYGAGNLGTKLALRLAERGANIYMYSRNHNKVKQISDTLNLILPKYSTNKIKSISNTEDFSDYFDAIVSFIAADKVINKNIIFSLKKEALVLDGGINNYTPEFYFHSHQKLLKCFRLDVRLSFYYSLCPLLNDVKDFFTDIQGIGFIEEVRIVSGGIIGDSGDVVVDKINSPQQIIGIANGIGGLKDLDSYTHFDKYKIQKLQKKLPLNKE